MIKQPENKENYTFETRYVFGSIKNIAIKSSYNESLAQFSTGVQYSLVGNFSASLDTFKIEDTEFSTSDFIVTFVSDLNREKNFLNSLETYDAVAGKNRGRFGSVKREILSSRIKEKIPNLALWFSDGIDDNPNRGSWHIQVYLPNNVINTMVDDIRNNRFHLMRMGFDLISGIVLKRGWGSDSRDQVTHILPNELRSQWREVHPEPEYGDVTSLTWDHSACSVSESNPNSTSQLSNKTSQEESENLIP